MQQRTLSVQGDYLLRQLASEQGPIRPCCECAHKKHGCGFKSSSGDCVETKHRGGEVLRRNTGPVTRGILQPAIPSPIAGRR